MFKRVLLVLSLSILPTSSALADRDDHRDQDRDHGRDRGHYDHRRDNDRHHDRHYVRRDVKPRTVVSFNFEYAPYRPYYRHYYYPPRTVVYGRPIVEREVIYINNQPVPVSEQAQGDDRYCREYTTTTRISGSLQQAYGTACQQPDGTWEIQS